MWARNQVTAQCRAVRIPQFQRAAARAPVAATTIDQRAENGLQVKWRRKIEKSMEGDFETDSVRYKSTMRLGSGWTDWRSVCGTPGT